MNFTDRYISVPIKMFNTQQANLTGKEELIDTWFKFLPFELSNYKPTLDDDESNEHITHITLKNGYGVTVYMSPTDFELLLNKHQSS